MGRPPVANSCGKWARNAAPFLAALSVILWGAAAPSLAAPGRARGKGPTVATGRASSVTANAARLSGAANPHGHSTTYHFQYGRTSSYGSTTPTHAVRSGTIAVHVSANPRGLADGTTYHYRIVARNAYGVTHGADRTFTTPGKPPTVATGGPESITQSAAAVSGTVNTYGHLTSYQFQYGTTPSYGSTTPSHAVRSSTTAVNLSAHFRGLINGTTYHYRIIASDAFGITRGLDQTFTTPGTPPTASTGGPGSITQSAAIIRGTVNTHGHPTSYQFQYGTTPSYADTTTSQAAGTGTNALHISANLSGLTAATTYHYRVVASNAFGTTTGSDQTFTTLISQPPEATEALATYDAMQKYFYAENVVPGDTSSLYAENYPQSGNAYSYLWPFSRALVGTITLSGIPSALLGGATYQADVTDRLTGLSRYWDSTPTGPGYDSYPAAPYGDGGDKYYDDQAWIGLATAQNYALTGDQTSLTDAENAFNFVYPGGWASSASFDPGGIYWIQQGVGRGATNHRRMAVSNAPNAELGLLLGSFTGNANDFTGTATYDDDATQIYQWADHFLLNVNANPTDPSAPNPNYDPGRPALMFPWITSQNTIANTLYPTPQGSMIAASVREYRLTGNAAYLSEAEAIANTALSTFDESYYVSQPVALDGIFFRGLLVLYSATNDTALKSKIISTIATFASDAWVNYRSATGLFKFPSSQGSGYQLLDQGAMLQIYAMLAWDPSDYANLP
jgi:fructose-specific component phosphotransferase system IIB-like protein